MTITDTLDLDSVQPFSMWADSCSYLFVPDSATIGDTVVRPSLFLDHSLATQHEQLVARADMAAPVWVFGLLLLLVVLTTVYCHTCKLRVRELLLSLFDSRAMDRMLRNNNFNNRFRFIPMGLLAVACTMLPIHLLAMNGNGLGGYLLLVMAAMAFYLLRNGLARLLAVTFDNNTAVDGYITSNYLYHLTLTIVALPLLFLLVYLPGGHGTILNLMEGLVVIEYVLRLFRGLKLFLTQSSGPYVYLFYYLCIVEMAPILILIKWFVE